MGLPLCRVAQRRNVIGWELELIKLRFSIFLFLFFFHQTISQSSRLVVAYSEPRLDAAHHFLLSDVLNWVSTW